MSGLPEIGKSNKTSSIGDGGGIKMKSQLTRDGSSSSKATSPQQDEEKKVVFSPNSQSKMSNFFNTKGPIKTASMMPAHAMVNGPIMAVGHNAFQLHQRPHGSHGMSAADYYDDEDDYGDEE